MRTVGFVVALSLLGLVLGGHIASAEESQESQNSCTSALNSTVPDENDGSWNTISIPAPKRFSSPLQEVFYNGSSFYKNKENGMLLNIISLFGKVSLKTWTCSMDLPPTTTRMSAMQRVDGTWYVREDGDFSADMFPTFDAEGHLTALMIMIDTELFQYRSDQ